jgi:hypothetical protein
MSRIQRMQEFSESTDSRFLSVIPVAAVATSTHETIVIGSIARFDDHASLHVELQMGPDHPEHEWRRKGRGGHPNVVMIVEDDLGTEYMAFPGGGGGGMYRYDFHLQILPGIPDNAARLTLALAELAWEGPFGTPIEATDTPSVRWRIDIDLSKQVPGIEMNEIV